MLVLKRKIGQSITVGDPRGPEPPVEVVILSVRGELVEIGVTAFLASNLKGVGELRELGGPKKLTRKTTPPHEEPHFP